MNFTTSLLHLLTSGAFAYINARNVRDPLTRPNTLALFQLAESGSVPFLEALQKRAIAEGDPWLGDKLGRHASDEKRHGQIFASALHKLGKDVIDFKTLPESELAKRRRSPFFDTYFEGYPREQRQAENIDWLVFMGSTYILEFDAAKDFARMANVLPEDDPKTRALKKGILSVAQDETRHAAYLYEALQRRLPASAVDTLIEEWRTRKVKATLAAVTDLIQKGGQTNNLVTNRSTSTETEKEVLQLA